MGNAVLSCSSSSKGSAPPLPSAGATLPRHNADVFFEHTEESPDDGAHRVNVAHKFPVSLLTPETLSRMAVSHTSGRLRELLNAKMTTAKNLHGSVDQGFLRIGIGLRELGSAKAVIELWPARHRSPRRWYKGKAGSLRVLHGTLKIRHYENLDAKAPILIEGKTDNQGNVTLEAGQTTWMNKESWCVNEVESVVENNNDCGFALLLRVYDRDNCTDESAYVRVDPEDSMMEVKLLDTRPDLFWNIDTDAHICDTVSLRVLLEYEHDDHGARASADEWCKRAVREGCKPTSCYQEALREDPKHAPAWFGLGLAGGDDSKDARHCYQTALEHDRDYYRAWLNLGGIGGGVVDGEAYDARRCFAEALRIEPKLTSAWIALGNVNGGPVGDVEYTQKECYQKALLQHQMMEDCAPAWFKLGRLGGGSVNGDDFPPGKCYQYALECRSDYTVAWIALGILVKEGDSHQVGSTTYTRKQCFLQALNCDKSSPEAWIELGREKGCTFHGEAYTAEDCFVMALAKFAKPDRKFAPAWLGLGMKFKEVKVLGKTYTSQECFKLALQCDEDYTHAWVGLSLAGGGQVDKYYSQQECAEKAVMTNPKDPYALTQLGRVKGGTIDGEFCNHEECFIKALEVSNLKHCDAWLNLAKGKDAVKVRGVNYTLWRCSAKAVQTSEGKSSQAWVLLGKCGGTSDKEMLGSAFSPEECYQKAVELDKSNKEAWRLLAEAGGGHIDRVFYTASACRAKAGGPTQARQGALAQLPRRFTLSTSKLLQSFRQGRAP